MTRDNKPLIVFVHGWSVRNTDTYGQLPQRLKSEAERNGMPLDVRNIWLSKYISFHNEVRLQDISRAFNAALERELGPLLKQGRRFAAITHSTGGPVVRDWLQRFYLGAGRKSTPLSHLIMLAPANFGSALAQLGRTRIARLRTWFEGVEPGLGVLDWLELGSPENWTLNMEWLARAGDIVSARGTFPFVLASQTIDRTIYDHVNAYTGEQGSDGVVRLAAANLNTTHVQLTQQAPRKNEQPKELGFSISRPRTVADIAFALAPGRAHSGDRIGIMRSVRDDGKPHPTVTTILECLQVRTARDYARLTRQFREKNVRIEEVERVEAVDMPGPFDRTVIHDPCSMLIFRLRDDQGNVVKDFDLMLTAGDDNSPDRLPPGFFIDRQKNHRDTGTLTYYLNYARMMGAERIERDGAEIRPALPACESLGLRIVPYPQSGFVHYLPGVLTTSAANLRKFLKPHQTTLIDIVLHRVVRTGVLRLSREMGKEDFTKEAPGGVI